MGSSEAKAKWLPTSFIPSSSSKSEAAEERSSNDSYHQQNNNSTCFWKHPQSDVDKLFSSEWYGMKKSEEAWWRKADLNDLVLLKSLEHNIDNCDLPLPKTNQTKEWLVHYDDKGLASFDPQTFTLQSDESKNMETQTQRPNSQLSKGELLEALRRSQKRAREAEKAAQEACKEKQHIITLFLKQASQIFAYKQWLYILHLETLCNHPDKGKRAHKSVGDFVLGLALVGAGVLLGWTLGWFFHHTL